MKKVIPNVFTFINLALGVLSILIIVQSNSSNAVISAIDASIIILIAALMDRIDGKIARAWEVTSDLGKQLDSLSDLVSFGLAPIVIAWKICLLNFGITGYILAIVFPIAGAYRLARYNITHCDGIYSGLPITVAGAFLAIGDLYNSINVLMNKPTKINQVIIVFLCVVLPVLMVSKFRFKKV